MKHIYISSIAILLLVPQLSFGVEPVKGYTQQELENLKKYSDYIKNWNAVNATMGDGRRLEEEIKNAEKLRTVPRPINELNYLEDVVRINNIEADRLLREIDNINKSIDALEKVPNSEQMRSRLEIKAANNGSRINDLDVNTQAAKNRINEINIKAKQVIAARPAPLPPPPRPTIPTPKPTTTPKPGIFAKLGNFIRPTAPKIGTGGNIATVVVPIIAKDVITPFLTPAEEYISNLEKRRSQIEARMKQITEETKNENFSNVPEKNALRNELQEVERMIRNYHDRVDAANGVI